MNNSSMLFILRICVGRSVTKQARRRDRHKFSLVVMLVGKVSNASCAIASQPCFRTLKALHQHQRVCHGVRNIMRFYADAHGTCRHCGSCFQTRLHFLRHLIDTRRTLCADGVLASGSPMLSAQRVEHLDLIDKLERRRAQREGRSHPIAVAPAVTSEGKCIGHVQR